MKSIDIEQFKIKFGQKVKDLRKAQGYSQESFAHECDLHRTYMGGVERGERNISLENILKIAVALKVSPADLLS